jgi:succinate dehydrogenase / fumarate reductase flavoprotein subunit
MYHQFKELADVDITREAMEIAPTCHYVMGGVEVEADSGESKVPGLYAVGEVSGGMHGSNRLGGNSLSDLLVFGRRAGLNAAYQAYRLGTAGRARIADSELHDAAERALTALSASGGENPYAVQQDLQEVMQRLVGIIRTASELEEAQGELAKLKERAAHLSVSGDRRYNPGWHLAIDIPNMLLISECVALAALTRQESRGGHTRDDFPGPDPYWGKKNLVLTLEGDEIVLKQQPLPVMPDELKAYFE